MSEALAGGGDRAEQFKAGAIDGLHYLQAVEPIKQLKREGRLNEALALCYVAIEGAERAARREKTSPPPFYTEQQPSCIESSASVTKRSRCSADMLRRARPDIRSLR
ncbi:hypothetical protein [Microbacterium sp. 5K110]|uniref:hypothetical protein n=1 Tax=unclassified Microbacterium TaxID=2609290 RepID=UPI0010FE3390|nr:hypothetical protein [Microbacterium sp. 5K110]TLF28086.1 hypothetical protein FE256_14865 [Microbacterium sp. 5K110]